MAKTKYKVLCDRMQGTGLDCKQGQVIEVEATSDNVKSLVKRGWIEEVKTNKKSDEKSDKKVKKADKAKG